MFISCASLQPLGSVGPKGEPGPIGATGPIGPRGPAGKDGKGIPDELIEKIEKILSKQELIVGASAYTFGIAPRITGFVYLTSKGNIYKLENKNPRELGNNFQIITQIASNKNFISLGRTTYGDDIKQFFTAVTQNGEVFTSENLEKWNENGTIPISN